MILIDEESIIKATSPILSDQFLTRTAESNVFRLLLTGTDDSSVIAKENLNVAKGRQAGKAEVLETLLQRAREQLKELGGGSAIEERDRLVRLEAALQVASSELGIEETNASALEQRRRETWTRLREVDSRLSILSELQKRFDLLQKQYSSDLRRLEAITEASVRLDQMSEERCAVCGARAEHHDRAHQEEQVVPADVAQACNAEAAKTSKLLQDLQTTRTSTTAEIDRLAPERVSRQAELEATGMELKSLLQPRLQLAVKKVQEVRDQRDACRTAVEQLGRVQELEILLAEAKAPRKKERAEGPASTVTAGQAEQFSKDVEALLRSWHFPSLDRVTFSEKDKDIVISGRARRSHGKGVRAITRAAFNLALLRLCAREERPFPGLVILDSPLVVYREPDNDDGMFPNEVKDAFYESIAADFSNMQVIILENDNPPNSVRASANIITFTGSRQGRAGFIPRTESRT